MNFFKAIANNFVFIWLSIMFVATTIPGDKLHQPDIAFFDKFEHFASFAILSFFFCDRYVRIKKFRFGKEVITLIVFLSLLYAGFDELHQKFIPGRFADYKDFIADFVGVIIGIVTYYFTYQLRSLKRED